MQIKKGGGKREGGGEKECNNVKTVYLVPSDQ